MDLLRLDAAVVPEDLTLETAEAFGKLEPYGAGNPVPLLQLSDVVLRDISAMGGGRHTRFTALCGGKEFGCVWFMHSPDHLPCGAGERVDLALNLEINEFMGRRNVQLIVRDVRLSETQCAERAADDAYYQALRQSALRKEDADVLPTREDFAMLYRLMLHRIQQGKSEMDPYGMMQALGWNGRHAYARTRAALDILAEAEILSCEGADSGGKARYRLGPAAKQKTDLTQMPLYLRLKNGESRISG